MSRFEKCRELLQCFKEEGLDKGGMIDFNLALAELDRADNPPVEATHTEGTKEHPDAVGRFESAANVMDECRKEATFVRLARAALAQLRAERDAARAELKASGKLPIDEIEF